MLQAFYANLPELNADSKYLDIYDDGNGVFRAIIQGAILQTLLNQDKSEILLDFINLIKQASPDDANFENLYAAFYIDLLELLENPDNVQAFLARYFTAIDPNPANDQILKRLAYGLRLRMSVYNPQINVQENIEVATNIFTDAGSLRSWADDLGLNLNFVASATDQPRQNTGNKLSVYITKHNHKFVTVMRAADLPRTRESMLYAFDAFEVQDFAPALEDTVVAQAELITTLEAANTLLAALRPIKAAIDTIPAQSDVHAVACPVARNNYAALCAVFAQAFPTYQPLAANVLIAQILEFNASSTLSATQKANVVAILNTHAHAGHDGETNILLQDILNRTWFVLNQSNLCECGLLLESLDDNIIGQGGCLAGVIGRLFPCLHLGLENVLRIRAREADEEITYNLAALNLG